MGCDIHGWIEVRKYNWSEDWDACMDIQSIVGRNYRMFGALFDVRNYDQFNSTAPDRGLPADVSDEVKAAYEHWENDAHSASWITLQEIKNINWDECGESPSERIDAYKEGSDQPFMSFYSSSDFTADEYRLLDAGETVTKHSGMHQCTLTYKRNVKKKADAKSSDWDLVFSIMEQLQAYYDEDVKSYTHDAQIVDEKPVVAPYVDTSRVRLVVWFDS